MSTVNFSVPDAVKDEFNATFAGQNKSAIIADLMREAVVREQRRRRSVVAAHRILARRSDAPVATAARLRAAREAGRP